MQEKIQKEKADRKTDSLKNTAQNLADKLDYNIIITRVAYDNSSESQDSFIVYYVSKYPYNDWYKFVELVKVLNNCHGGKYMLKHVKLPNGNYATLSDWKNRRS